MITQIMKVEIGDLILEAMREKPQSMADLKAALCIHEVPIKIAIRDLQNQGAIEHGYLMPSGEWVDDYFPDESELSAAWRICKQGER